MKTLAFLAFSGMWICGCTVQPSADDALVGQGSADQLVATGDSVIGRAPAVVQPENQLDSLGRKQGIWRTDLNGKPWKIERYKDGKRHGVQQEFWANGEIIESTYAEGLKHGAQSHYHLDSSVAVMYSWHERGNQVWIVFPWELEHHIVPVKGWSARRDSVEISVPYVSGQLMYSGYLNRGERIFDVPYGMHRSYYPNGRLRAIIDYDQDSMTIYSPQGAVLERTTPRRWRGRTAP
jgi:antitoxin component YwqK of YwqJK toxin-antitoxin module